MFASLRTATEGGVVARNTVVRGTNDKPAVSQLLAEFFESSPDSPEGGELFIGYPITTAAEGKRPIDAVFVSPHLGVIVFDLVEGTDLGDYQERQDDQLRRIDVKLRSHRELVSRRNLLITINTVTFAPALSTRAETDPIYHVTDLSRLAAVISGLEAEVPEPDIYAHTVSALQSVSGIRRSSAVRAVSAPDSRGAILKSLENSIATLDAQQSSAVIETARDVQRIRGLAGSGKTVVLALKAAYLHAQHPDWRIAVTFQTRSLRAQFKRLINNFTIEQAGDEPDWSMVQILPSWGAPGGGDRDGVYYRFCSENGVQYFNFGSAKAEFGGRDPLGDACSRALESAKTVAQSFDVILVDEAQDLPPEFLRMCYQMLGDDKRLVYAYDELQTLNNSGLPPAEEIFGSGLDGRPLVTFDEPDLGHGRRDIILERCYRNSRPVLTTAHALGFGIYRAKPPGADTSLVQIFEQKDLWSEIGYEIKAGKLQDGESVTLARTSKSSPDFLENHSPIDDLIRFRRFDTAAEQAEWLASQVQTNLTSDELAANDIIIINPDPFTTRANAGIIRKRLLDLGIDSHLAGVDTHADVFFPQDRDSVTVTGVNRAKGNEAGMVYVVNAQESLNSTVNLARIRNRLFTAITRSKAWVRVTGVGVEMDALIAEFERVKAHAFQLDFIYPTEAERAKLQVVHRDMSRTASTRLKQHDASLIDLAEAIQSGEFYPEDLDSKALDLLRNLLRNSDG